MDRLRVRLAATAQSALPLGLTYTFSVGVDQYRPDESLDQLRPAPTARSMRPRPRAAIAWWRQPGAPSGVTRSVQHFSVQHINEEFLTSIYATGHKYLSDVCRYPLAE